MSPLFSVIIPVYNTGKYLPKCIESVLGQTFSDFELIIVDDGSADESAGIASRYASIDSRITLIREENRGQAAARNTALDKAAGEWILFLDSDDWIDSSFLSTMKDVSSSVSSPIVCARSVNVGEDGTPLENASDTGKVKLLNGEEIILCLSSPHQTIRLEVWNKIWKRDFIGNVRFKDGQVNEEVYFDRLLFMKAESVAFVDSCLHFYRVVRPGNTNSKFRPGRLCVFDEYRIWAEELEKRKMKRGAAVIYAIAADTACGLYAEAVRTGQEKKTLEDLRSDFTFFFPSSEKKGLRRIKFSLFRLSPSLYCAVSRTYKALTMRKEKK